MRSLWLLATTMFACSAHAAPLTYDAALRLADQTAPSLQASGLDVRAARSSAIAAGRLPDPKLEFGVEGFPVSGPLAFHPERDDFSNVELGVMQDVPSGASAARRASAPQPTLARPRSAKAAKRAACV